MASSTEAWAAARLRPVFAVPEFRMLWAADVLSTAGDQLARVALAVLVFNRTGSAWLTGLGYAATFVPAFLGGALFGGIADRVPRRTVLLTANIARAALVGVAAVPAMPVWAILVLVAVMTLFGGPFSAAEQAVLPDIVPEHLYPRAMAVRSVSGQTAQLAGFGIGGVLVSATSAPFCLAVDAMTFVVALLLIAFGVRTRPAATTARVGLIASVRDGAWFVATDPVLRPLTALIWLALFYVAPESLAAPYAHALGGGPKSVGLLMAADPIGSVVGGVAWAKWVPEPTQRRVIGVLGVAAGAPLLACALTPSLLVSMMLFALCGAAATAYTIQASVSFMKRIPDGRRAHGAGMVSSGLITMQGIGALVFGAVADAVGPGSGIAIAGGVGMVAASAISAVWAGARVLPCAPKPVAVAS